MTEWLVCFSWNVIFIRFFCCYWMGDRSWRFIICQRYNFPFFILCFRSSGSTFAFLIFLWFRRIRPIGVLYHTWLLIVVFHYRSTDFMVFMLVPRTWFYINFVIFQEFFQWPWCFFIVVLLSSCSSCCYIVYYVSLELDVAAIDSAVLKSCLAVFATLALVMVNMCSPVVEYSCMLVRPNVDLHYQLSSICSLLFLLLILLSHSLDCDKEKTWWT